MYYVCECGVRFLEDEEDAERDHMIDQHLDIIETRFEDFLDDAIANDDAVDDDELFDEAIDDVTNEMLDTFED
jgi:hypothetical protein